MRALAFALGWSALETTGVAASAALWAVGRGKDHDAHFALQRWWANRLLDVLRHTAGLAFEAEGIAALAPGPIVMCARHASLADALIPVWLLSQAGMRPRYVLKDDLQLDPFLDIVGNRLPNHFVDRDPGDSSDEIAARQRLSHDIGQHDACRRSKPAASGTHSPIEPARAAAQLTTAGTVTARRACRLRYGAGRPDAMSVRAGGPRRALGAPVPQTLPLGRRIGVAGRPEPVDRPRPAIEPEAPGHLHGRPVVGGQPHDGVGPFGRGTQQRANDPAEGRKRSLHAGGYPPSPGA